MQNDLLDEYEVNSVVSKVLGIIRNKCALRRNIPQVYADLLVVDHNRSGDLRRKGVDWDTVNAAIVARWPRGLNWIKERARELVRGAEGSADV